DGVGDRLLRRPASGDAQTAQELAEGAPGDAQLQRAVGLHAGLALETGDLREQGVVAREGDLFVFRRAVDRDGSVVTGIDAPVPDKPAQVMTEFRAPLDRQLKRLAA